MVISVLSLLPCSRPPDLAGGLPHTLVKDRAAPSALRWKKKKTEEVAHIKDGLEAELVRQF